MSTDRKTYAAPTSHSASLPCTPNGNTLWTNGQIKLLFDSICPTSLISLNGCRPTDWLVISPKTSQPSRPHYEPPTPLQRWVLWINKSWNKFTYPKSKWQKSNWLIESLANWLTGFFASPCWNREKRIIKLITHWREQHRLGKRASLQSIKFHHFGNQIINSKLAWTGWTDEPGCRYRVTKLRPANISNQMNPS